MTAAASLEDKYLSRGLAFMTGIQALVRLPMLQKERDEAAGLDTAGYISGYRGSPLARYDMELLRARPHLDRHRIHFAPGINEDLALTSVWGSQQAEATGTGRYDGVFAIWYGKGPGVDRSGDAFRHGNLAGSAKHGGVLCLLGDDHTCESSSTAHQSDFAMVDYMIPTLNPASVGEIVEFGLHGWALSRFSGLWVALKCVHDVVEASAVVDLKLEGVAPTAPSDFDVPADGLNLRIPDTPHAQEVRLHKFKLKAAQAYARANKLDRVLAKPGAARVGIITTGKAHLEFVQALSDLGLDLAALQSMGVGVYKVGMSWPLEPRGARNFCAALDLVLVIEEKRALVETQLKEILFGVAGAPVVIGKLDEAGETLFPASGALSSNMVAIAVGERIARRTRDPELARAVAAIRERMGRAKPRLDLARRPHFCAGCPHSTSTRVPEGSRAIAGTGCSYMVQWMDRRTLGYTQMGADGTTWIGEAPFSTETHVFQNMGDGTYFHSGLLAIRATVAAGVNITYKILFNDAVAMTGGQPHDGGLSVHAIAEQVLAEGVKAVAVVSDDVAKYAPFPRAVTVHHRRELDAVQKRLRETSGTTVLVYDQTCAAEKRRRRRKGAYPDPDRRIFINEEVCEGCGDCGVQSNCVAILPLDTPLGRKRLIDQSACNKDFSCTDGFCPSFVSVRGAKPRARKTEIRGGEMPEDPMLPDVAKGYAILIAGVGGTGVVTVSALLGMAARLEDRGCALLDMTGLAQKGGSVVSHVRILPNPTDATASRIGPGGADVIIGADMLVAVNEGLEVARHGHTRAVVNTAEVLPGSFTRDPDLRFPALEARSAVEEAIGEGRAAFVDATRLATDAIGDSIATNVFLLGFAYQSGLIPLRATSLERAIELNGVAVRENLEAFRLGRRVAADPKAAKPAVRHSAGEQSLEEIVEFRARHLEAYQSETLASRYRSAVERVAGAETARVPEARGELARAVAVNLAKLMSYKDEYEVARLYSDGRFAKNLQSAFEGDYRVAVHLAPPILSRIDPSTKRPRKRAFGPWIFPVLAVLSRLKGLRGTRFDPFGWTEERRSERQLIADYLVTIDWLLERLSPRNHLLAVEIARAVERIRGFGPVKMAAIEATLPRIEELKARYAAEPAPGRSLAAGDPTRSEMRSCV